MWQIVFNSAFKGLKFKHKKAEKIYLVYPIKSRFEGVLLVWHEHKKLE
jgi:hypothetical protein